MQVVRYGNLSLIDAMSTDSGLELLHVVRYGNLSLIDAMYTNNGLELL